MPVGRYLREDAKPIMITVATAKAVTQFDLCGLATNTYVSAADTTWNTDLATTQSDFRAKFVGIVTQAKPSTTLARVYGNSTDNAIRVATSGVWEMDCASATFEVGDYVGPAKDTGNALLSNKVVGVAGEANAIGRVVERGTSITRVKFRLLSDLSQASRYAP